MQPFFYNQAKAILLGEPTYQDWKDIYEGTDQTTQAERDRVTNLFGYALVRRQVLNIPLDLIETICTAPGYLYPIRGQECRISQLLTTLEIQKILELRRKDYPNGYPQLVPYNDYASTLDSTVILSSGFFPRLLSHGGSCLLKDNQIREYFVDTFDRSHALGDLSRTNDPGCVRFLDIPRILPFYTKLVGIYDKIHTYTGPILHVEQLLAHLATLRLKQGIAEHEKDTSPTR